MFDCLIKSVRTPHTLVCIWKKRLICMEMGMKLLQNAFVCLLATTVFRVCSYAFVHVYLANMFCMLVVRFERQISNRHISHSVDQFILFRVVQWKITKNYVEFSDHLLFYRRNPFRKTASFQYSCCCIQLPILCELHKNN